MDPGGITESHSDGATQTGGPLPSSVDRFFESWRELRLQQVPVNRRTLCVWALVLTVVCGLHLSLFVPVFHESWYAPLHFLWVLAGACGVSWWCLRPHGRRLIAVAQTVAFVVVSCGISWAVARVPWGSGLAGEASLPLSGGLLIFASFFLVAVSLFLTRRAIGGSGRRISEK